MYVAVLAVLMFATVAVASVVSTPILGFSATGTVSYNPFNGVGIFGRGSGVLTTATGGLPIGTAVDWIVETDLVISYPATVSGSTVTQDFFGPTASVGVTLPASGGNVLAFSGSPYAYITGVLGGSSATIVFALPGSEVTSSYITGLPSTVYVSLVGTTSVPLSLASSNCSTSCPWLSDFALDWSFSLTPTPPSPTPEPSSLALLGGGLLSAAVGRWAAGRSR